MFFFLLRGDLMSAWSYTFAQLLIGSIIVTVYLFGRKYGE